MKIVLASPSYNPSSGGIIALHKLCDTLIRIGYTAGFYKESNEPFYVNSAYKHNHFTIEEIDVQADVVIYPEITWGNPLNMKRVVRYIMNTGHITLNRKSTWNDTDFWLYYSDRFYDGLMPKNILTISDSKLNYFRDYGVPRTHFDCFTYRKRADVLTPIATHHSANAIEISFNTSDEELITIFNICERFYSYDTQTHLSVLASLCGCDSIIISDQGESRSAVMDATPAFKYGVAFGVEEIQHARTSRNQLRTFLEDSEQQQEVAVGKMFNKILSKI